MRTPKGKTQNLPGAAVPFRYESGWTGAFTRDDAPGAIPAGSPIVKCNSEKGDSNRDGTRGTVLGSFSHPDVKDGAIFYFVEWESAHRVAVGVMSAKVQRA